MTIRKQMESLLLVALLATTGACAKIEESVSRKDEAVEMLNERRYDEAIVALRALDAAHPEDDEIKIFLASAYVGASGFDVVTAFDAFAPMLAGKTQKNSAEKPSGFGLIDDPAAAPAQDFERTAINLLDEASRSFRSFVTVPFVPKAERPQIVEALAVLARVPAKSPQMRTARMYASVLNLLQFINYFRDTLGPLAQQVGGDMSLAAMACALDAPLLLESLETLGRYLSASIDELALAFAGAPRRPPTDLTALKGKLEAARVRLATGSEAANVAEVAMAALKTSFCAPP